MDSKAVFWIIVVAGFTAVFFGIFFIMLYASNKETKAEINDLGKLVELYKSEVDVEIAKLRLAAVISGVNIDSIFGGDKNESK